MSQPDRDGDVFLRELRELRDVEGDDTLGLVALSEGLEPIDPGPELRARVLESLARSESGRFSRFTEQVGKLLDLSLDRARALLDRLDDPTSFEQPLPGVSFFWVEGGPRVANAVRGFLRVAAGTDFPVHEHLGLETVLVLQGGFVDPTRGVTIRAGDLDRMPESSSHHFTVPADGPDLLILSVTQVGARVGEMTYLPR